MINVVCDLRRNHRGGGVLVIDRVARDTEGRWAIMPRSKQLKHGRKRTAEGSRNTYLVDENDRRVGLPRRAALWILNHRDEYPDAAAKVAKYRERTEWTCRACGASTTVTLRSPDHVRVFLDAMESAGRTEVSLAQLREFLSRKRTYGG